jgi:hypothetical protein
LRIVANSRSTPSVLAVYSAKRRRRKAFGLGSRSKSLDKLAELKDAKAWGRWLKDLFDKAEAEARQAAEKEIERSRNLPETKTKDKWKLRVRIISASHSIRLKVLSDWNEKSNWIKLSAVSGKKNELLIDFVFGDNVPV